jgi:uncharacterized membrane protein
MYKAKVQIRSKDYLACNRYYLKKYLGVREYLMVGFLFVASIAVFLLTHQFFLLILSGVVVLLLAAALGFYQITSVKGYKMEFTARGATHWEISFNELGMVADTYEKGGEAKFQYKCLYSDLEKVAILKDRIYLYVGAAMCYYVPYDSMTEGDFISLCDFLKESIPPEKFRMRTKKKQFPYSR